MTATIITVGNVSIRRTVFANFKYEARMRQGDVVRVVYFGNRNISTFLDQHRNKTLKKTYYDANKWAINQALNTGDLFSAPILEWKILWNKPNLRESVEDYVDFIQNYGKTDTSTD